MSEDPSDRRKTERSGGRRPSRAEFRAQVNATRADIERQMHATRAQIDATNERIQARTGRNLILATLIGLGLGLAMLFSLIVIKELFIIVAVVIGSFTAFELSGALRAAGRRVPPVPTVIASVAMVAAPYFVPIVLREESTWDVALGGILFLIIWRCAEQMAPARRTASRMLLRDLGAGVLVLVYVPFLASFMVLLLAQDGGQWWVLAALVLVIAVDTGAYASGLTFGRHLMAPTISPKKTWEGFAGAGVVSIIAGILLAVFMLNQDWWVGPIIGLVILFTATIGDLAESLIKRDLGIKDMSSWLPGHGGILDRVDSILPSAAAAYALFLIFN